MTPFTLDLEESKVSTSSYNRCRDYFLNMAPDKRDNLPENEQNRALWNAGLSPEDAISIKLK
jgi:hypothetical protein